MVQVVMTRCKVLGLYRRLLRLHQRLPGDLGSVGQRFVQQEFKSHRESSTEHATLFLKEWTSFADTLSVQLVNTDSSNSTTMLGERFSNNNLDLFSEQQLLQLFELANETKKHTKT